MSDPRLEEWLALSRAALVTDDPEAALEAAAGRRDELQRAIEAEPPGAPLEPAFARELLEAEQAFQRLAAESLERVAAKLGEVQRVRNGTRGYRALRTSLPAFVSRSI